MPPRSQTLKRVVAARRWTEEDARVVVEAFRASGLSAREFGARLGVHPVRLLRWAARRPSAEFQDSGSLVLAPVDVRGVGPAWVEVVLGTRMLRIPATLEAGQVAMLIRAVESA